MCKGALWRHDFCSGLLPIRHNFNRVMREKQSYHVRPTLGNRNESGPIVWKKFRRVWGVTQDPTFAHDSSRFHQPRFISRSFQIQATALLILTLIFNDAKLQNFYLHSSFSIVIDVILTVQWKSVVISTSHSLLFVRYVNVFVSVPTHTQKAVTIIS